MIGFPYTYGDELSEEKATHNLKLFIKQYGPTLCVNGLLILLSNSAYAADSCPDPNQGIPASSANNGGPTPSTGDVAPAPADPPVFQPLLPPTKFIHSRTWGICGIGAITWICVTAAITGNPSLIFACSSLLLYAIGVKE